MQRNYSKELKEAGIPQRLAAATLGTKPSTFRGWITLQNPFPVDKERQLQKVLELVDLKNPKGGKNVESIEA